MPLGLFKYLDLPWEQARGPLRDDLESVESSFNDLENGITPTSTVSSVSGNILKAPPLILANSQIKTLPTVYPQVVPAPGLKHYLMVHRWALVLYTPVAYTNVDNTSAMNGFSVAYGDYQVEASTYGALPPNNTAGTYSFFGGAWVDVPSAAALTAVYPAYGISFPFIPENLPLKLVALNNSLGNFTGGGPANNGKLTVYYSIEDL